MRWIFEIATIANAGQLNTDEHWHSQFRVHPLVTINTQHKTTESTSRRLGSGRSVAKTGIVSHCQRSNTDQSGTNQNDKINMFSNFRVHSISSFLRVEVLATCHGLDIEEPSNSFS